MHAWSSFVSALAILVIINLPVSLAQPSPVPNCYLCPETDVALYTLTAANYGTDPFVCFYGEPYGCSYDLTTGTIINDYNEGLCRTTAIFDCAARAGFARRDTIPKHPRTPSPAASEAKPDAMHIRARLGGKRRIQKDKD
ncbi:hypothetical protein BKA70DRAFT_1431487 [Coprinopsis sp. MPI-PUGE-AT-0042]|nr:hypothetical protein BKA70DRAFT_1431487 [Coprinopsis sp. MPI-PUGE-AT-0042]